MLNHHCGFGRPFAGPARKVEVRRFTPTLEDIEMSIEVEASLRSDARPDVKVHSGSEYRR